jgi:hypothetical protein
MHLNDNQLLESDAFSELHLSQCKSCQLRAANVRKIRDELNQIPSECLASDSWEKLKYTYQLRTDEIKQAKNKQQIKMWKFSTAALAASLILAIIIPSILGTDRFSTNQYRQLTLLIEQNNLLQQELIKLKPEIVTETSNFNLIRYQLSMLDQDIQRAHVQQLSIKEKTERWQKKQDFLKQLLINKTTMNTLHI